MTTAPVTDDPVTPVVEGELGEVVEVFTGESLEEAMATAVAALGPDLQVRRARKVRSGVRGLMGKDRYEVLAVPAGGGRPTAEAVTAALEGLLERAESEEAGSAPLSPAPAPVPTPAPAPALRRSTPVAAPRREPDLAERAPHPEPAVAQHSAPAPGHQTGAEPPPGPGVWSRRRLLAVGVPAIVVDALPVDDPIDDLGWLVAVTTAVSATVPEPASADAEHPAVMDGHGTAGALALLDAGVRGTTPGSLTHGGRTVAATALELALAVRAAVLS